MATKRDATTAAGAAREKKPEKMKRLTIDLPESLHRRIKRACADSGRTMADEIRQILAERFS